MLEKYKKIFSNKELLLKNEKEVQTNIKDIFEDLIKLNIIEEERKIIKDFKGHSILILKDLENAIKRTNKNIFKKLRKENEELTETYLTKLFLNDFIKKFDKTKTNTEKYNLYFDLNIRKIEFTFQNKEYEANYVVLDVENYETNYLRIVKEKRIPALGTHKAEFPDFAIYMNGLPFIAIEVKTVKEGIQKAFRDAREKTSYRNFLFVIGTTGNEAFIMSDANHSNIYKFQDYEDNGERTGNQFLDISLELILNPKNLMFYAEFATLVIKEDGSESLMNARVQQYYALKKIEKEMQLLEDNHNGLRAYIKHHTRTGKSFTFKLVMNLILRKYLHIFDTIYFFTHDVSSVLASVKREMGSYEFGNKGKLREIKNITAYKETVKSKETGVFIVNIQKIYKGEDVKNNSNKVLILIDEIHTHQAGEMAKIRDIHFPNASYLGATATPVLSDLTEAQIIDLFVQKNGYKPSKEEIKQVKLENKHNLTESVYGKEIDNFSPKMALELGLVTPLSIYSYNWEVKLEEDFMKLEAESNNTILKELETKKEVFLDEIREELNNHNSLNEKNKEVLEKLEEMSLNEIFTDKADNNILERLRIKIDNKKKELKRKIRRNLKRKLYRDVFDTKIEFIIDEVKRIQENSEYRASFFWVVEDTAAGLAVLSQIKDLEESDEKKNIYKGVRFGLDISNINEDIVAQEDKEYFHELYGNNYSIDDINGKYISGQGVIGDFESQEEGSIDVLILVNKKLMGYDNKELTAVFLDKEISDIKLIMQLATRPTTKRAGKECGYIYDLSFKKKGEKTSKNIQTLNNSFTLYNKEDYDAIIFSKDFLENVYVEIETSVDELKEFFKDNGLTKNSFSENIAIYSNKLISLYNSDKTKEENITSKYFTILNKLNGLFKQLINPMYQMDKDNKSELKKEVSSILDITAVLNNRILNDSFIQEVDNIWYTEGDIRYISRQIFETFGKNIEKEIEDVSNIMHISGKGKTKEELDTNKLSEIQSKAQKKLIMLSNSGARDTEIFSYFEDIAQTDTLEEAERKYKEAEQELMNEIIEEQKRVAEYYNGKLEWFITDRVLKLNNYNKKISEFYAEKILKEIEKINVEIGKNEIAEIVDKLDTQSYNFVGSILTPKEQDELMKTDFAKHWKEVLNTEEKEKFKEVVKQIVGRRKLEEDDSK